MSDFLYRTFAREEPDNDPPSTQQPTFTPDPGSGASVLPGLVVLGALIWFLVLGEVSAEHIGRITASLAVILLGVLLGLRFGRKRKVLACLGCLSAGLALS